MAVRSRSTREGDGADRTATLSIWLLGPFRVAVGTCVIDEPAWRLRKARSLIKLLALAPGHRLHREQAMEALWSGLDATAAANNLHQVLHFARHTLQPDLPRRTSPDYLRLHDEAIILGEPARVRVDVNAFEAAATVARRARDPAAYREAARLYTGDLLPDDLYEDWVASRREELQQAHRALLLELARLHEERAELSQARTSLTVLLAADPVHEEAHVALMRLYALGGERHQALRQYRQLQEALKRELGIEPDASTQRLYQDILAGGLPKQVPVPAYAEAAATVEGVPRKRSSSTGLTVPKRTLKRLPGNLPAPLTSFVGRERELAEIKETLSTVRMLTLLGPGGCGKTRLALQVAAERLSEFEDGTWFVDLALLTNPDSVPATVASSLGLAEAPSRPIIDRLADHLRSKRLLLVLDNCEHLREATADLAAHLLQTCPRLQVVATSRQTLHTPGEMTWRVPSLSLPERDWLQSGLDLMRSDAVRLFVERGRLVRPDFKLTSQTGAAVVEICRRLDGLPLAIELAAARLKVLSLDEMVGRLQDRFKLLVADYRKVPSRQQTLRGTIDWSFDLLTQTEQALFIRLAAFRGGFTLDAAEAVCAGDGIAADDMLDLLAHLIDKSMVVVEEATDGSLRYRLLETLREYGWERLVASGESGRAQRQHANFFAEFAELASRKWTGAKRGVYLDRLEQEHGNIRAALDWSVEGADAQIGLRVAGVTADFWSLRGHLAEGRTRLSQILALPGAAARTAGRATALCGVGWLARSQADYADARAFYEEGLAIQREVGDKKGIARALSGLGILDWDQGDNAGARSFHEQSLTILRELGDKKGIASSLNNLGLAIQAQGDHAAASSLYRESLAISRELGNQFSIANDLNNLANIADEQGDYETARRYHEESVAIRRELGDRTGLAFSISNLGNVLNDSGNHAAARLLYEESLAICREVGARREMTYALNGLGNVARLVGDFATAYSYYAESLSLRQALGDTMGIAKSLESFVRLAVAQEQPQRAVRLAGAAAVVRERFGVPLSPVAGVEFRRHLEEIRDSLGDEACTAAWNAGRALTLEQAIADALGMGDVPSQ